MTHITLDFETRSAIKIQKTGAWVYSEHWTTDVICLSFSLGADDEPKVWVPDWVADILAPWYCETYAISLREGSPWLISRRPPSELTDLFGALGVTVEAHNAFFERSIFRNVMHSRYGWPIPSEDQWRCSAAKAAAHAIPRSLEGAAVVMSLQQQKDAAGHSVMQKVCRPRRARKAEAEELRSQGWVETKSYSWVDTNGENERFLWNDDPADLWATILYCRQDVRAERELSASLRDLSDRELAVWQCDQKINLRGLPIDRAMAEAAVRMASEKVREVTALAVATATTEGLTPPFESLG